MRVRRVLAIVSVTILLASASTVFVALSDFGAAGEPVVVNGIRLRRHMAHGWSMGTDAALSRLDTNAIPWLVRGLDARDSDFQKLKRRAWKLLPTAWQQKWRNRAPMDPFTLRVNCVRALDMFGSEAVEAAPKLIQLAKTETNVYVRAIALEALAQMACCSPPAKDFLVASLRDGEDDAKAKVVTAFMNGGFTPPEAVPLLIARLKNYVATNEQNPGPLNEMAALSTCGPEAAPAAPVLMRYIKRGGPGIAVRALRPTGPAAVVALSRLLEILEDGGEWVTTLKPEIFAIFARLGTNGGAALPALTNGLSDPNPVVRTLAVGGIARITGDVEFAVPRLIELFENRDRSGEITLGVKMSVHSMGLTHREIAAMLLGELGAKASNALPSLKAIVTNQERGLYACVAEAIWKISKDTSAALPPLTNWLQSSSEIRRMWSMNVLGQMGPAAAPAIPAIRASMDSNLAVRRYGYNALRKIAGTDNQPCASAAYF